MKNRAHEDVVARPDAVGAPPAPRPANGGGAAREIPDRRVAVVVRRRTSTATVGAARRAVVTFASLASRASAAPSNDGCFHMVRVSGTQSV